jgi:hypothetical protein
MTLKKKSRSRTGILAEKQTCHSAAHDRSKDSGTIIGEPARGVMTQVRRFARIAKGRCLFLRAGAHSAASLKKTHEMIVR